MTLYYTILWVAMIVTGVLMYEQPLISRKKGKVLKALQQVGWMIMFTAMLGLVHGVLGLLGLIQQI